MRNRRNISTLRKMRKNSIFRTKMLISENREPLTYVKVKIVPSHFLFKSRLFDCRVNVCSQCGSAPVFIMYSRGHVNVKWRVNHIYLQQGLFKIA